MTGGVLRRGLTLVAFSVSVATAGCGGPTPTPSPSSTPRATGGTLRIGMDLEEYEHFQKNEDGTFDGSWDPSTTSASAPFELFRCCLLRNLMSYNGRTVADGGVELQPDISDGFPEITADGLTWTFHLKEGLTYAPPMADVPITSYDFVRAMERAIRQHPIDQRDRSFPFGPYARYLADVVVGANEFTAGAASISGLETPDAATLVIHLKQPAGDLGARLAMPAYAPLPPGAAEGHDTLYGSYLVASGPYMIAGSDDLRPDLPAEQQPPVSGYVRGESLTLVRNPSWDDSTDALRAALPDRIEFVHVPFDEQLQATLDGEIDLGINVDLFLEQIEEFRADPQVAPRLHLATGQASRWILLNLAAPPFDDLHVRRAVQFATNRATIAAVLAPGSQVQTHAIPDMFTNGLLADYDPYGASDHAGNVPSAIAEMAQSRYDTDGDGSCDDPACLDIPLPVPDEAVEIRAATQAFASQMAAIGLTFDIQPVPFEEFFPVGTDPTSRTPLATAFGWTADYLNAASWFVPLARSTAIGQDFGLNVTLVGASPERLTEWGYTVTDVPSVDAKIDECVAQTGGAQFVCWAELDQFMMERVASWVPIGTLRVSTITSSFVTSFEFDDSLTMPSLGRMAVTRQ